MAGCSLTLCWLDDELETLLSTPAAAPGLSLGDAGRGVERAHARLGGHAAADARRGCRIGEPTPGTLVVRHALEAVRDAIDGAEEELGRLDAVAGDGDHGAGMARGTDAAAVGSRQRP